MMMRNPYLKFCVGAMGCGKTRKLQGDYYSKVEDHFETIIIKPIVDVKGDNKTLARDGGILETTFLIADNDNVYMLIANYLLEHNLDFILVDEAQFLKKHHIDELSDVVDILGINVICYGLRTDFLNHLFEGSKRLFEVADSLEFISRQCSCGNNKIYNMRISNGEPVFDGEQIAIDGVDAVYESLCRKCYKDIKKKILSSNQVKVKNNNKTINN